jgi:hypothetical protein
MNVANATRLRTELNDKRTIDCVGTLLGLPIAVAEKRRRVGESKVYNQSINQSCLGTFAYLPTTQTCPFSACRKGVFANWFFLRGTKPATLSALVFHEECIVFAVT